MISLFYEFISDN